MSRWLGWRARLRDLLQRTQADARANEELQLHLDMETERFERSGHARPEARRLAMAAFGGMTSHRESLRSGRRLALLEDAWQDLRVARRGLGRDKTFALVAVGTLAVAVGMATTMVGVVRAVQRDGHAVRASHEIDVVWQAPPAQPGDHLPFTYRDLAAYTRGSSVAVDAAGVVFQGATDVVFVSGTRSWPVSAAWVTGNFLSLLGVTPALGRLLTPGDDAVGAAPVMVISFAVWQVEFGGSFNVIGQAFDLSGRRHRIVGVLPRGFEFPRHAGVWLPVLPSFPATQDPAKAGSVEAMLFDLVIRRRAGTTYEQVTSDVTTFLRRTDPQRPMATRSNIPVVQSLQDRILGTVRPTLLAAAAAVVLLLLVACVNVANLLLIRGGLRGSELAIRHAVGARRARLVRQLLTEAALLAALGGAAGIALAWMATGALRALAPAAIPHRDLIEMDVPVLLAALAITIVVTMLCGVVPALLATRSDLSAALRGGRALGGRSGGTAALRRLLVVGQIAMAVVILIAAGLVTRSLRSLLDVNLGFDSARLTIVEAFLPGSAAPERGQQIAVQAAMLRRVRALPGVQAASVLSKPPFSAEGGWIAPVSGGAQSAAEAARNPFVDLEVVGDGFFNTMSIPLRRGRAFDSRDRDNAPLVAIVNGALAHRLAKGGSSVGDRLKLGALDGGAPWLEIVAVAGDTRYREIMSERPTLYLPASQFRGPVPMTIVLRHADGIKVSSALLKRTLAEVHPALRVASFGAFTDRLRVPLARPRFAAALFAAFGGVTLLLCVIGIYGAIAAAARERRHEFGVRLALGEQPASVRRRMMLLGAQLTVPGLVLGVTAAIVASQWLEDLLFGVGNTDLVTYLVVITVVCVAAGVACWIPAAQAARVEPLAVLREAAT